MPWIEQSGEGTVSVPVRVVSADPLPSSYRDIEWDPPAGKTITAYRVYYTEPGGTRTLFGTYAGNVESVRVADLSPDKTGILFEVEGDYTATATAVGSATGGTGPTPPSAVLLTDTVNMKMGGMDVGILNTTSKTYTHRFRNIDTETITEAVFEFCNISPNPAPILGFAYSVGGSANDPGPGGWVRITFNGGQTGYTFAPGSADNPVMASADPIVRNWTVGESIVTRISYGDGDIPSVSRTLGLDYSPSWPDVNLSRNAAGDWASTDELLAQTPTWSGLSGAWTWYAIRVKRATAVPHIITHGDSVNVGLRPADTSGYGYHVRLQNLVNRQYYISSYGKGGITMGQILARHNEIVDKTASFGSVLMYPTWSGNAPPNDAAGVAAIKANIASAKTIAEAAGMKFWLCTLKPHGGTITTQAERDAYWELVDWATEQYGVRHIDLSREPTLSADGGLTLLNSSDNTHFDAAGQQAQAVCLQPRIKAAFAAEGVTIT